jgi:hypothetical protein
MSYASFKKMNRDKIILNIESVSPNFEINGFSSSKKGFNVFITYGYISTFINVFIK